MIAHDPLDYLMNQSRAGLKAQDKQIQGMNEATKYFGPPQKTPDAISAAIDQKPVSTPMSKPNGGFQFGKNSFSRTFSEQSDLAKDADDAFYGGGNAPPRPTPTPTPGTRTRQLSQWTDSYGWGS